MTQEQFQRVAELEVTVARLEQREKRLRAVLASAFTSHENRSDAREKLASLLNSTEEVEDELLLLESPDGRSPEKLERTGAFFLPASKVVFRRRLARGGEVGLYRVDRSRHLRSSEHRSAFSR
jgi:hypothetical protein